MVSEENLHRPLHYLTIKYVPECIEILYQVGGKYHSYMITKIVPEEERLC
jgi:hypothetical protein